MSSFQSRIINFVRGKTEEEVQGKLVAIALSLDEKIEVVNIYYNSGKGRVIAWYFHDVRKTPMPPREPVKVTKKKVTKKRTKKS